jgi:hypothetical protein
MAANGNGATEDQLLRAPKWWQICRDEGHAVAVLEKSDMADEFFCSDCSRGQLLCRELASSETQEERSDELAQLREELAETNEALAACQSQAGGRERAAFEAGMRTCDCRYTQAQVDAAYAAYESQSSPSQPAETPQSIPQHVPAETPEERKDAK